MNGKQRSKESSLKAYFETEPKKSQDKIVIGEIDNSLNV